MQQPKPLQPVQQPAQPLLNMVVSNPTGGRCRLPVVFLCLAVFTSACSKAESPPLNAQAPAPEVGHDWADVATAEAGDMLWDTPPLPQPIQLKVNGEPVLWEVVEAYLLEKWSVHCGEQGFGLPIEELSASFFSQPEPLFRPLVRGVLLLREAERRFPTLDPEEVAHYQQQMEQAVGTALDALKKRYGATGWRRHVARQLRLRKLLAEFSEAAPEVTEEEVYAYYDQEILSQLPTLEQHQGEDISLETLGPQLRELLERNRATEAEEAWLDEEMEGCMVSLMLPDDRQLSWVEHSPPAAEK